MRKDALIKAIMEIALKCHCTLCCRVSPKQKAEIVKMVREYLPGKTTLAIGYYLLYLYLFFLI